MSNKVFFSLIFLIGLTVLTLMPVFAVSVGSGVGIDFVTDDVDPMIFMDTNTRLITDDNTPTQRYPAGNLLNKTVNRTNNYAFEGEKIQWRVLAFDRNGIETINTPKVIVGTVQGTGSEEAPCSVDSVQPSERSALENFNARDGTQLLNFSNSTMRTYTCIFTVEGPNSSVGFDEFFVTAEVSDADANTDTTDENEFWFFNPTIALSIDGDLDFGTIVPGATAYSETLTIGNDATPGSGVLLEMFISGTDFTDPSVGPAKCPVSNVLELSNFRYLATNGAFSSRFVNPGLDTEGYDGMPLGNDIVSAQEIIGGDAYLGDADLFELGNVLAPGAEVAVTLKLNLPIPCEGDFTDGNIFFWALAV